MKKIKLGAFTMSLLFAFLISMPNPLAAQVSEGGTFDVSGTVSVSTSTTGTTTVQVNVKNDGEAPDDPIIVEAKSDSKEDIEAAKDKAGRELLDKLLGGSNVKAGPDGKGDYRGGGDMPDPSKGPVAMPGNGDDGPIFDIDLSPIIQGKPLPPMRRSYEGTKDLRSNFLMDFQKALRS